MRKPIKHIDSKMNEFANRHKQISSYKNSPITEFKDVDYPLMWNFYGEIRLNRGELEIEVTTLILDRVLEDTSNFMDVQNDTSLLVCDFTTYFTDDEMDEFGFEMNDTPIASPVVMDYDSTLVGYTISSFISIGHDMDKGEIPLD